MLSIIKFWLLSWWSERRQFARFLLVGAFNFGLDFLVYYILTREFVFWYKFYLGANAISFLLANISSYLLNSRWTFSGQSQVSPVQYFHFLSVSLIYLGVIEAGMWLLVSGLGWFDLLAKFLVNGTAAVFYFMVLRLWVFKSKDWKQELGRSASGQAKGEIKNLW